MERSAIRGSRHNEGPGFREPVIGALRRPVGSIRATLLYLGYTVVTADDADAIRPTGYLQWRD
jgi:hypothetical protein